MATWETTSAAATWLSDGRLTYATRAVLKITDNENDLALEVNKAIKVTYNGISTEGNGTFLGSVTMEGVAYPVISVPFGGGSLRIIVGLDDDPGRTMLAESAFNASAFTVCFFPGTLIATPSGERKVEELASGDLVSVGDSGEISSTWFARMGRKFSQRIDLARSVPVKWIGRQTISTRFGTAERLMPVRFTAGSLGGGGATPSAA